MAKVNLNKVAKTVSQLEGGAESLSIAQIKEVIRFYNETLVMTHTLSEVLAMFESLRIKLDDVDWDYRT